MVYVWIILAAVVIMTVVMAAVKDSRVRRSRKCENAIWQNLIGWGREEDDDDGVGSVTLTKYIDGERVAAMWTETLCHEGYANIWSIRAGKRQLAWEKRLREDEGLDTNHGVAWKLYQAINAANP